MYQDLLYISEKERVTVHVKTPDKLKIERNISQRILFPKRRTQTLVEVNTRNRTYINRTCGVAFNHVNHHRVKGNNLLSSEAYLLF